MPARHATILHAVLAPGPTHVCVWTLVLLMWQDGLRWVGCSITQYSTKAWSYLFIKQGGQGCLHNLQLFHDHTRTSAQGPSAAAGSGDNSFVEPILNVYIPADAPSPSLSEVVFPSMITDLVLLCLASLQLVDESLLFSKLEPHARKLLAPVHAALTLCLELLIDVLHLVDGLLGIGVQ
jgi:hypothetical protein